jgi:lysophospholipase L1-like esterase
MLLVLIIFIVLLLGSLFVFRLMLTHLKPSGYPDSGNISVSDKSKPVLVCFGDSNTHGNVSYNWVNKVRKESPGVNVFNAGVNSDLTFSLLRRVDDVVLADPDYIAILIGTNDVNAAAYEVSEKRYRSMNRLMKDEKTGTDGFEANLKTIIQILKSRTKAKIALLSLPLMGEDLANKTNTLADEYSAVIMKIATFENLSYIPVREEQKAYLLRNPTKSRYVFEKYPLLLARSVVLHYFFGRSWNKISQDIGNVLSPDFMHQNDTAGKMIADQVIQWIND